MPQRILLIRPSALGDVARTVPALVSLRRAFPQAEIDWLVNDSFVDAVAHHPALTAVVPFPRGEFKNGKWHAPLRYMRRLRARSYDTVYDLQGLARSGWLTWSTRAPKRVGPSDARELGWLAYNHRVAVDPSTLHTVDRMMAVLDGDAVPPLYDMRLYTGEADRAWAAQFLAENHLEPDRFALVAPSARWKSKCWPTERFDALINRLAMPAVIAGANADKPQAAPLIKPGRIDIVGKTSVGKLMALIERSAVVVANDSAALHLAVGLGRRAVGIFGPTDPRRVGPFRYDLAVAGADPALLTHYRAAKDDQSIIASVTLEQAWRTAQAVLAAPPPTTLFA
jgi:heptosyltransferase-1